MATILPNGKTQFIDQNGRPLVAGKVFYYEPGTETFKDTYADLAGTIVNENPVTLDGRGQAAICGIGTYRQVTKDKNGSTIWDEEVSEMSDGLAASDGASRVGFIQAGGGAVKRTAQNKMREIWSVADFGATSGSDVGIALQRAHDAGESKVLVNFGQYKWDTPVTLLNALKIVGEGYTEGANAAAGTWCEVRQQNFTPLTFSGGNARGGGIDGVAFWETNHPSGAPGWTPAANDYLIKVLNCEGGVEIGDVLMARANRGIYCYNSGRLHVRKLRGQFFTAGIEIDRCLDIPAIDYVHAWPFFTSDSNIMAYQQANLDVITTRRCDGVFLGNVFTLGSRSSIRMSSSSYGYTTKLYCNALYADLGLYGLWVDSSASHSTGQIANFTGQGERWGTGVGIDNGAAIRIDSNDCVFQVGSLHTQAYWNSSIVLNGLNNEIDFGNLWFESDNQSNTNSPHIFMANGVGTNRINVSGYIRSDGVNNPPMVNGSTNGNLGVGVYANRPAGATDEPRLYWGPGGATLAAVSPNAKSNLTLQGQGDGIVIAGNPMQIPRFSVSQLTPALAAKFDACMVMVGDRSNRIAVSISTGWVWQDGTPVA
ncbi:hypothetical protein [Burkholderia cepacia]|uniref:hypothetical protein n=1 Tax=Burkholderia cepacia TaxID=292 RepID=UPI002FE153E4